MPLNANGLGETGSDSSFASLSVIPRNGTSDIQSIEPFIEALSDGYLVGWAPTYTEVTDVTEFANDETAFQSLADNLLSNMSYDVGEIWIPPENPNGNAFTINATVTMGSTTANKAIFPQGWMHSRTSPGVSSGITDGSALFEVRGDGGGGTVKTSKRFGNIRYVGGSNDSEFIRFISVQGWTLDGLSITSASGGTAAGVITVDTDCFSWTIDNLVYYTGDNTANVIELVDDAGTNPPGNCAIGTGVIVSGTANRAITSAVSPPGVRVSGHYEKVENDVIHFDGGQLFVSDNCQIGVNNPTGTGHGIYHDGDRLYSNAPYIGNVGGDAIHVAGNVRQCEIYAFNSVASPSFTNAINVESGVGNEPSRIPFPQHVNGSITNNGGRKVRSPNGLHLEASATDATISSGGEIEVQYGGGGAKGWYVLPLWDFADNQGSVASARDVEVFKRFNSSGQSLIVFSETTANGSVDIDYEVYVRG